MISTLGVYYVQVRCIKDNVVIGYDANVSWLHGKKN